MEATSHIFLYHPFCFVSFSSQRQAKTGKKNPVFSPSIAHGKK